MMQTKATRKIATRFVLYFLTFYVITVTSLFALLIYGVTQSVPSSSFYTLDEVLPEDIGSPFSSFPIEEDRIGDELQTVATGAHGTFTLLDDDLRVIDTMKRDGPATYTWETITTDPNGRLWTLTTGQHLYFELDQPAERALAHYPERIEQTVIERYSPDGVRIATENESLEPLELADLKPWSSLPNERKEWTASRVERDGSILVARAWNEQYEPSNNSFQRFVQLFIIYHIFLFVLALLFSLWIGLRFGRPIFHFLKWQQRLSARDYSIDKPKRLYRNGTLRRRYQMFDEFDESLETLSHNLATLEKERAEIDTLREQWITGLSHDLKTPLSSIYGYAALLASYDFSKEEVRSYAETMEQKAKYMDTLLDDLTYTYQLKHGIATTNREPTDWDELFRQYVSHVEQRSRIRYEGETAVVSIDRIAFERVHDNLIHNALRYSPEHSFVDVTLRSTDSNVQFSVWNEGAPLTDEAIRQLFDRYYRGTNTTESIDGTGLGLAITASIVESHGGTITARNERGGIQLTITLPRLTT